MDKTDEQRKYRIAIVDDEKHCIESLQFLLQFHFTDILEVVYTSQDPVDALSQLVDAKPDLLFLDVEMPSLNGFELLENLPDRDFDVIFTTAYSQYAVQAFKTQAINYLLKPIDKDELTDALAHWREKQAQKEQLLVENLLAHLRKEGVLKSRIALRVSDGIEFVDIKNIMYCKSQSNYTTFYLADGQRILISRTMGEIEKQLASHQFIRAHRSYLINPNYMKKYYHSEGGYILMENDETIPVSNQNKKLIREFFDGPGKNEDLL